MASNKNIFCASNPTKLLDALWDVIKQDLNCLSDCIIFMPSRRAVRSLEKLLAEKCGGSVILPALVALGEEVDDPDFDDAELSPDVISNRERIIILSMLLAADANIKNFGTALPIARDLVRMQDYLENEGINSGDIDWAKLVDEKYAVHFQKKADFLRIVTNDLPAQYENRITESQKKNQDIRGWIPVIKNKFSKVIVCGSTASVPATSDLMECVANLPNGYIFLPGKISGRAEDFILDTNPYNSEYRFLQRISVSHTDVVEIDVGESNIDFYNFAFGNVGGGANMSCNACTIECARESEEAECVAEIAKCAVAENKTVLIITPDSAGNQRIASAFEHHNLIADFSGGISGSMTCAGRAILNYLDDLLENKNSIFDRAYKDNDFDLFKTLLGLVESEFENLSPQFQTDTEEVAKIWPELEELSNVLMKHKITLELSDVRDVVADTLSGIKIRPPMNDDAKIMVLGTIESRMQTADIIILTGLNEGMFPAQGYENSWLPRHLAKQIGLPPPDRKVSLMALDFMNLSCAKIVYWLRSKTAGSAQTTESRFLSRVNVASAGINTDNAQHILSSVRARDNVSYVSLDYSAPRPPADNTDVYVTELELLIHNPYAFYARHILRLHPKKDWWQEPDARDFGNLVHDVTEESIKSKIPSADELINKMDERARAILPAGSVIFHFWHKRFVEIAPAIESMLKSTPDALAEIAGCVKIAGRTVRARADMVWDGAVLDIKTGAAPSKKQLSDGNMPQLPLEAYMLQNGGFSIPTTIKSQTPALQFLQLQNNNVNLIEYEGDIAQQMIDASVQKVSELFGRYSNDYEPYEYYENTGEKYRAYDDLARVKD